MNILRREHAPLLPKAWQAVDEEAARVLRLNLAGRKLVDFVGPLGWEVSAISRGRVEPLNVPRFDSVGCAVRQVQPLIELRADFRLSLDELDGVARGANDIDLDPVTVAAEALAKAEDEVIFRGLEEADLRGVIAASPHQPIALPKDVSDYPRALVEGLEVLRANGIAGPYGLALGPRAHAAIEQSADDGYPIRKRVERVLDGPVVRAPSLEGAVLLSIRTGDYALTVGQDLAVGYRQRQGDAVDLFLVESILFQVLEPRAAQGYTH